MLFLIGLVIAVLFTALLAPALRRKPAPFFLAAALLAIGAAVAGELDPESDFLLDWVLPLLNKGALAAALWALVMWAGALPKGSRAGKRLLSVRGELSLLGAIFTLPHAAVRELLYAGRLFDPRVRAEGELLTTGILSLIMLLIMIPLGILSFKRVRRRMDPKRWKQVQKLAYPFYGLIYLHVLVLYLPPALAGAGGYRLTILSYTAVWAAYLVFRLLKRRTGPNRETADS